MCHYNLNEAIEVVYMVYWREYFAPWILERGYDYFLDGRVTELNDYELGYIGIVSGTENYSVIIQDIDELFDEEDDVQPYMHCTCPYADDGNNCKHMAAVLYAIEASIDSVKNTSGLKNKTALNNSEESAKLLNDTLDSLTHETLKIELQKILESNENLRSGFIVKYNRDANSLTSYVNSIQNTARQIRHECSDPRGFVDWRNASTYTSRLINEVLIELHDFTLDDSLEAQTAFDVSKFVLDMFATTGIDDDGDTQVITSACIDLWVKIISSNKDESLCKYIFTNLTDLCDKIGIGEYISNEIDDFISDFFNEGHFILDRLEVTDRRIKRFESSDSWNSVYNLSQAIMERFVLMNELGKSQSEIEEFKSKYWHLPPVRKAKMTELEAAEDWESLISLLQESQTMDKESPGFLSNYSRKLIDCYKKIDASDKVREELYTHVTKYSRGDVSTFCELKSYFHEAEWIDVREDIFRSLESNNIDIKPLLVSEKQKGRLMFLLEKRFQQNRSMAKYIIPEVGKYEK